MGWGRYGPESQFILFESRDDFGQRFDLLDS
jgi:hypothetical protein